MPTSYPALIWSKVGCGGSILTPMPNAACSVHPSISIAATPEEAHITVAATECQRRVKSLKHLIILDFPVPPDPARNITRWRLVGSKASKNESSFLIFDVILEFFSLSVSWLVEWMCCNIAAPIKRKALCCCLLSDHSSDWSCRLGKFGSCSVGSVPSERMSLWRWSSRAFSKFSRRSTRVPNNEIVV